VCILRRNNTLVARPGVFDVTNIMRGGLHLRRRASAKNPFVEDRPILADPPNFDRSSRAISPSLAGSSATTSRGIKSAAARDGAIASRGRHDVCAPHSGVLSTLCQLTSDGRRERERERERESISQRQSDTVHVLYLLSVAGFPSARLRFHRQIVKH